MDWGCTYKHREDIRNEYIKAITYALPLVETFKDYAVINFNIRKFIATVPQCGYGIIKLLKDLGFQHEGTMKENLVYLDKNNNPKLYDELVYGLIIK